jgi:hypothetical protein
MSEIKSTWIKKEVIAGPTNRATDGLGVTLIPSGFPPLNNPLNGEATSCVQGPRSRSYRGMLAFHLVVTVEAQNYVLVHARLS